MSEFKLLRKHHQHEGRQTLLELRTLVLDTTALTIYWQTNSRIRPPTCSPKPTQYQSSENPAQFQSWPSHFSPRSIPLKHSQDPSLYLVIPLLFADLTSAPTHTLPRRLPPFPSLPLALSHSHAEIAELKTLRGMYTPSESVGVICSVGESLHEGRGTRYSSVINKEWLVPSRRLVSPPEARRPARRSLQRLLASQLLLLVV